MTRGQEQPGVAAQQDADAPGGLDSLSFSSAGEELFARVFLPPRLPAEAVLLLHGLPGVELNFDLAHAFRRAGLLVLLPHYRGSWGMPGDFALAHVLADATAALAFMRSPRFQRSYGLAPSIALVGHSMGGFAALMAGAEPGADRVASLAGFDFGGYSGSRRGMPGALAETAAAWSSFVPPLRGTSAESLAQEALHCPGEWNLAGLGPAYQDRRVLLVCGERDSLAPPRLHHDPLVRAYRAAGVRLTERRLDSDHGFVDARLQLAHILVDWLTG
jgi:pimeloyl-ACP methyl ester carboxylesterase